MAKFIDIGIDLAMNMDRHHHWYSRKLYVILPVCYEFSLDCGGECAFHVFTTWGYCYGYIHALHMYFIFVYMLV